MIKTKVFKLYLTCILIKIILDNWRTETKGITDISFLQQAVFG